MKDGWMNEWLKKEKNLFRFFCVVIFFNQTFFVVVMMLTDLKRVMTFQTIFFVVVLEWKQKKNLSKKDFIYELQKWRIFRFSLMFRFRFIQKERKEIRYQIMWQNIWKWYKSCLSKCKIVVVVIIRYPKDDYIVVNHIITDDDDGGGGGGWIVENRGF